MEFNKGDRISWTRPYGKDMLPLTSYGEVVRKVKNKIPGVDKLVVMLDECLYASTVAVSQVTKEEK